MNAYEESHMEGARMCLTNALNLQFAAELTLQKKVFGVARSLFILSGEEAIKAHITASFAYDSSGNRKEFDDAYRNHKFKHDRIVDVTNTWHAAISTFGKTVDDAKQKLRDRGLSEQQIEAKIREDPFLHKNSIMIANYIASGVTIEEMQNWWKSADKEKQKGFYVDTKNAVNWHDPITLYKEEDAVKAKTYNHQLINFVATFLKNIIQPETFERLKAAYEAQQRST